MIGLFLGKYPVSLWAFQEMDAAICSTCAAEQAGWCGACETCLMMPVPDHQCYAPACHVETRKEW